MALTKVTGGTISTTSDYQINNIVGVAATFTTLNVSGVLTYEDVTNIESVGVATFKDDVEFHGTGAGISSAFWDKSANTLKFKDNVKAAFGDAGELNIWAAGGASYIRESGGSGQLVIQGSNLILESTGGTDYLYGIDGGTTALCFGGNSKIQTTGYGVTVFATTETQKLNVTGISTFGGVVDINNNVTISGTLDVDGQTDLDVLNVADLANFSTGVGIADSIFHIGDTNTAIRFPAADTITAETGGSERLRIESNGKIAIGNHTGASHDIHIKHASSPGIRIEDTTNTVKLTMFAQDSNSGIANFSNHPLLFYTNSINRIQLTNDGKVQIGLPGNSASLPGAVDSVSIRARDEGNLHIRDIGNLTSSPAGTGVGIDVLNNASNTVKDLCIRASTLIFRNASAETLRIASDGDVGIGINDPVARLQVNSGRNAETDRHSAANYHLALRNAADDNGESIGLSFGITSNATKVGAAILHERDGGGSQGSLQFYTSSDGNSLSEKLRITSGGLLLLGSATSDLSGNHKFISVGSRHAFQYGASAGTYLSFIMGSANGEVNIDTNARSGNYPPLTFKLGGSERMRLTPDGPHLLLGGTDDVNEITEGAANAGIVIGNTSTYGNAGIAIITKNDGCGRIYFGDGVTNSVNRGRGSINYYHSNDYMDIYTAGAHRLRINSTGHLTLGEASFTASNDVHIKRANAGGDVAIRITNNTNQNSGSTASLYFTTSPTQDFNTAYIKAVRSGGRLEFGYATNRATVVMHNDLKVGIARTTNSYQLDTSGTPSDTGCDTEYNLSINRECFNSTNTAYLGYNKTLNVDNQYAVTTFRAENVNRSGTTGWMDVAKFVAWDLNARVIIQAGGTFTGDQIDISVISSYNSALANGRSGPILEVRRTEGHNGGRFTKVRIGCHNSNRQPILQVYFDGGAVHNALGTINVTCHDYGSNYGGYADRGEARFQSGTSLNEEWESVDIDESGCDYFNTSTTPAFSAFKSDNSGQISSGTYAFNSQTLDRGGDNYNTSNGKFTAPCDGVYYFIATLQGYGGSSTIHARFQKNGTDVYNQGTNTPYYDEMAGAHHNYNPFCLVELSKDDYIECVRNGNTRGMQSAIAGFLVR